MVVVEQEDNDMDKEPWIDPFEMIENYVQKPAQKRRTSSFKGIKRLDLFDKYEPVKNNRQSTAIESSFDFEMPDENIGVAMSSDYAMSPITSLQNQDFDIYAHLDKIDQDTYEEKMLKQVSKEITGGR